MLSAMSLRLTYLSRPVKRKNGQPPSSFCLQGGLYRGRRAPGVSYLPSRLSRRKKPISRLHSAGAFDSRPEAGRARQRNHGRGVELKPIGRLHVLTDQELQGRFTHLELAELAIAGGADTIQFRQKNGCTRQLIETARQMRETCARAGVAFIVNDRLDVALACGADGVHLGQDDFPIGLARTWLGEEKIIGGSAANLAEALACREQGADYVGFGPVFPTASKDDAGPVSGLETLSEVARRLGMPVIAIGGIGKKNAAEVMGAGAHGIAVISAVCCQPDPAEATRRLVMACGIKQNPPGLRGF